MRKKTAERRLVVIRTDEGQVTGFSGRLAGLLRIMAEKFTGTTIMPVFPTDVGAEPEFAGAIINASRIQELGYDIGFRFLRRFPDSPPSHICVGRYRDRQFPSSDFFERHRAFTKALSETVERALWIEDGVYWNVRSIVSTSRALGNKALPINEKSLAGFSRKQREKTKRLQYSDTSEFLWTQGIRLADGAQCFVPAQLISNRYAGTTGKREPLLRVPNSNGLATHRSFEEACYRGLLELIERDAFMITYFNKMKPDRIDFSSIHDEKIGVVLDAFARYKLEVEILRLATDMPTCVILCVTRDLSGVGPALAVGAKADHDPKSAVLGALAESYCCWSLVRMQGRYREPLSNVPWNTGERLAYWGKLENVHKLSWLWEGPVAPLPTGSGNARTVSELARAAEERGCNVAAVRLSPKSLQVLGFHSVFVVSPQLQPLNLESHPDYRGGERLKSVPEALGFASRNEPPPYPHPFP